MPDCRLDDDQPSAVGTSELSQRKGSIGRTGPLGPFCAFAEQPPIELVGDPSPLPGGWGRHYGDMRRF